MIKKRLFTPGPTPIPEKVLLKMAEPIIHHRSPEFREIFSRVNENLKYLFQTKNPVITLTCSGTGGMESTFVNLFSPGDKIISVNGGKFGERWVKMPKVFGIDVIEIKNKWGSAPSENEILNALKQNPEAKAVYLTHSETSTGAASDIKNLAKIIRENSEALICVDGITAIGAHEFRFDEWQIDACVTGSQKGLMIPPGLAFVALSDRAILAMEKSTTPKFYFDLKKALKSYHDNDTPFTPAISLILAVDVALEMIREEGIEKIWKDHERKAKAIRAGIIAIGLKLFSDTPSFAVTPVWLPENVEWKKFNSELKNNFGITIAGGQEEFTGKIFRISHLGYYDDFDMVTIISALEMSLKNAGYKFQMGIGVQTVLEYFEANK